MSNGEGIAIDESHDTMSDSQVQRRSRPCISMASSRAETILVSSSGDVLTCRCRNAPYPPKKEVSARPYKWTDEVAVLCCDANTSGSDDVHTNLCSLWQDSLSSNHDKEHRFRTTAGGLLGGAPAAVAAPFYQLHNTLRGGGGSTDTAGSAHVYSNASTNNTASIQPVVLRHQQQYEMPTSPQSGRYPSKQMHTLDAFRRSPKTAAEFEQNGIVPIMSFDYSHLYDSGVDALLPRTASPRERHADNSSGKENQSHFLHGVPTFSPYFSNVKVRQVSAHPLGAHVLLISQAGLLYSYGLNTSGQLGIGVLSDARSMDQGYMTAPTIVTPLVENGGKAVHCAAGVNHSLVVVETEERRLVKTRSLDQSRNPMLSEHRSQSQDDVRHSFYERTESVVHHQMYGFGHNSFMKIGLVSPKVPQVQRGVSTRLATTPDDMECVVLPRRVALRCTVQRDTRHDPDDGVVAAVTVPMGIFALQASADHSAALVRRSNGDVELYTWGSAMGGDLGLPHPAQQHSAAALNDVQSPQSPMAFPVRVVPVPSFVAYLSRTSNADAQVSSLLLQDVGEYPVDVALGRSSSFVVTSIGRCFSFGTSDQGMLGLGHGVTECHQPTEIQMPQGSRHDKITSVSAGASHVLVCTASGNAYAWGVGRCVGLENVVPPTAAPSNASRSSSQAPKENPPRIEWSPKQIKIGLDPTDSEPGAPSIPIIQACAGNDCSLFVSESGKVFSAGKSSGRLGRGDIDEEIALPKPLFGGLHLFKTQIDIGQPHM
jgi:alpha-tubulin suppressor-like RCC1 family protein